MYKFYKIYFWVVGIFVALLIAGLVVLGFALSDYEANVPETVANNCFNDIKAGNFEKVFEGKDICRFEDIKTISDACREKCEGNEITLFKASSNKTEYNYVIKAGETRLMQFSVVPAEAKSKFGFSTYELGNFKFSFTDSYTIKAPDDCTVYVNGVSLGETDRDKVPDPDTSIELPDGIAPAAYYTYRLTALLTEPTVTATGTSGDERAVTANGKSYSVSLSQSDALKEKYSSYVIAAVKNYAIYMADDGYLGMITKYFDTDTATYKYIKETEVSFVWDHDSYTFTDEQVSDFHEYSPDVFTCRVKMTQNLFLRGQQPYHDYIDLTVCMRKKGDTYLVYSLKTN